MREQAVQFGNAASLTGIVSIPSAAADAAKRPALILLNSGILHRVGSCRLYVRTAREFARAGFVAFRFDFSGIGDSGARKDSLSFEESAPSEIREAMDHLQATRGITSFVLMGLCSGADMAHLAAVEDERVAGLIMLDAWAYRTPRYWLHHYGRRMLKADVWRNWARIRMRRMLGEEAARRGPATDDETVSYDVPKYVRHFPPREKVASDMRTFMQRGMRLFAIFTSGLGDHYNHARQYRRSLPEVRFGDRLREEYIQEADHILTGLEHQAYVIREARDWALLNWGDGNTGNRDSVAHSGNGVQHTSAAAAQPAH